MAHVLADSEIVQRESVSLSNSPWNLLLGLGLFQRNQLGFGQHQALLSALGYREV